MEQDKTCRICNGVIVSNCSCNRHNTKCENGHEYHWSTFDNEWHEGSAIHSKLGCCLERKPLSNQD